MKNLTSFACSVRRFFIFIVHTLIYRTNPFIQDLGYLVILSLIGVLPFKIFKLRDASKPTTMDLFFTSVSSVTVSSMSTVDMEVFSNAQLIFMTIMMFLGGEVFMYLLRMCVDYSKMNNARKSTIFPTQEVAKSGSEEDGIKGKCLQVLIWLVSGYLLVVNGLGFICILIYVNGVQSVRKLLRSRSLNLETFAIFTTVSTFTNCGFLPTNEGMMVFLRNSGLQLLLIPQILMGNTLFPLCLRFLIWVLEKRTRKSEFMYLLKKPRNLGYEHLLSGIRCLYLGVTILAFIILQLLLFVSMEWRSNVLTGLDGGQKFVASLFQVMNIRHSGENVIDFSVISQAFLVLSILMMYLPSYTSYIPIDDQETIKEEENTWKKNILFSNLTYLAIFVILICITERHKIKEDPLNFNVLSITFEVISAYGNVGLSMGYTCSNRISTSSPCIDGWYGFAGKWSNGGKFLLILVMLLGKMKKYGFRGGRAWILE